MKFIAATMQNLRKLITKQVYSVFDLDLRLPSNEGVSMQKKCGANCSSHT